MVINVRSEGQEIKEGVFRLRRFVEGADYKDFKTGRSIWSIGRNMFDRRIEASSDSRYYDDPSWECLFLR